MLRFTILPEVKEHPVFSPLDLWSVLENPEQVFFGEVIGLCSAPFAGSKMIQFVTDPRNPEHLWHLLIPSQFTVPAFDYPIRNSEGRAHPFLLFAYLGHLEQGGLNDLIASAPNIAEAMELAYAHRETITDDCGHWFYQIVDQQTMKLLIQASVDLSDTTNRTSWDWSDK